MREWDSARTIKRFESKFIKSGDQECWTWSPDRASDKDGYGIFSVYGRTIRAHRYALSLKLGRILASHEWVLHSCDNPPCVNPAHLRIGDGAANALDRGERGREAHQVGELHGCATLTEADVHEIRRLCALPKPPRQWQIAEQFGISQPTVSNIKNRRSWEHL